MTFLQFSSTSKRNVYSNHMHIFISSITIAGRVEDATQKCGCILSYFHLFSSFCVFYFHFLMLFFFVAVERIFCCARESFHKTTKQTHKKLITITLSLLRSSFRYYYYKFLQKQSKQKEQHIIACQIINYNYINIVFNFTKKKCLRKLQHRIAPKVVTNW